MDRESVEGAGPDADHGRGSRPETGPDARHRRDARQRAHAAGLTVVQRRRATVRTDKNGLHPYADRAIQRRAFPRVFFCARGDPRRSQVTAFLPAQPAGRTDAATPGVAAR